MQYFSIAKLKNDNRIESEIHLPVSGGEWEQTARLTAETQTLEDGGIRTTAVLSVSQDVPQKCAVRFVTQETDWDTGNYVFAPAALYNGNRFASLPKPYAPMLTKEEGEKFAGEPVITDVPRLSQDGNSCAQLSVGDLSVPSFGYFAPKTKTGYLLFFEQENELGNFGVTIRENAAEKTAELILSSPCVRTPYRYAMCTTKEPSNDEGALLRAGDTVTFRVTEYHFSCESIPGFLNFFFVCRNKQPWKRTHPNNVPWYNAFRLIEDKYNRRNWVEDFGFYTSSEASASIYRQWQTGWVGGCMNTLPGLLLGNDETQDKSRRTLDFVFTKLQHPSGFLRGVFCDGRAYGDNFLDPENDSIVMSRKNADALYYLTKQFLGLREKGEEISPLWTDGLKKLADAFVTFYDKNCNIGQFIDMSTGELYIGGSASGGLVGAGLALCSLFFHEKKYLEYAEKITRNSYNDYIAKGFSNGGPGEILSAPDSESAFALLESFMILYRMTEEDFWLSAAEDCASLCASWCVGYDYHYKDDTQLAARHTATTGAVWANVQNKHAAPGICTMSGESLLHLYRATGNEAYLTLIKDISHNLTQFVSTPENPIYASYIWDEKPAHTRKMQNRRNAGTVLALSKKSPQFRKQMQPAYRKIFNPVGRINERVNLSDWEGKNNVGEIPFGSCWCEVAAMLTYLEIPAVYVRPDDGFCLSLDHIECELQKTDKSALLILRNPTIYDAKYRIMIDKTSDCPQPLSPAQSLPTTTVFLRAGEKKTITI